MNMDQHRSIKFPTNKPVVLSYHHYNNNNNNNNSNTSNRNKPTLLKKSNILINSSFISENNNHSSNNIINEETQNYDFPKSRPISAASRPKIMQKKNNYDQEIFTKFRLMKENKANQINEINEHSRPESAMKNCWQAPGPVLLNNVTLGLNLPNNKPTLLERYWKYNKIKKGEVLTNRCYDSEDGRFYVLCTASYLQNVPKLIRQRPKSGLGGRESTVSFSNPHQKNPSVTPVTPDYTKTDNNSKCGSSASYYSNNSTKKTDKEVILPMRSSLKGSKNQRRCVSATPILTGNFDKSINNLKDLKTETQDTVNNEINDTTHQNDNDRNKLKSDLSITSENKSNSSFSDSPGSHSPHVVERAQENHKQQDDKETTSDYVDYEINSKYSIDIMNKRKSPKIPRSVSTISAATTSQLRPKSSTSTSSVMTNETFKKYYSVSEFNKFKNKLIDRKVYSQQPHSNLDQVYNDWLYKPVPKDKKYIAGKYSLEMKRMNHTNLIKKRQLFLSESLFIKKINLNIE